MYQQAEGNIHSRPRWQGPAAVAGILFGLVGFYEPAKDLYKRFNDPDAYKDVISVEYADMQRSLWQKNGSCVGTMEMRHAPLRSNVDIRAGACPNGDVLVQMYPQNRPAVSHWISLAPAGPASASAAGLFPAAMAGALTPEALERVVDQSGTHKVQMAITTVCKAWEDGKQTRLVRVVNENGQCFKEITNVYSGRIEYREPSACETKCGPQVATQ